MAKRGRSITNHSINGNKAETNRSGYGKNHSGLGR
jgi:hypothetical protein